VFTLDDLSVGEWLAVTKWTAEMSAGRNDVPGLATCETYGGEGMTCGELAWALILQAADEAQLRQLQTVHFAA
jgi:hypothetical protein